MVYGMARQSGGAARIESQPGNGTAVKLLFRKADGATVEIPPDRQEAEHSGARAAGTVLVIDDDPDVRGFIVESLEDNGYVVREAGDGREGLKEVAKETPDLVILDFIMPGLSGAEVASRILAKRPDQPILFVSGYSETEAVKSIAPDATVLAKPFRADALERAVRGVLASKR
jgi:CheY-like chemotaxis protein